MPSKDPNFSNPQNQPAWLAPAWAELGQRETPGASANPRIRDLHADARHAETKSDEIPWCAAYVSACLERSNILSTRSLRARDYLAWGTALDTPRFGAIAVLSRDPDPNAGHVAFFIDQTADHLILLGGNQSNAVTVQAFPKSRLLSLRWPEVGATPVPASKPQAATTPNLLFEAALTHVLEMEGGYTNDPADPGGPTNFGITLADYAGFIRTPVTAASRDALIYALQHIPVADARAIYLNGYWLPSGGPQLPPALAVFHFDTAVNMGTGTAIRMLQTALDCQIDGELGPQTIAAAASADPAIVLATYADLRRRRYRTLSGFPRFGRGWLSRVDTTLSRALALITKGNTAMTTESVSSAPAATEPKWWGQSLTIWGAIITGLAAVLPAVGPAFGFNVSPATVHTAADQIMGIAQAAMGLAGTLAAIYGRTRAIQPLIQRTVTLKV
ncbi:MAG: TIGR02594 family protein [Hyphomicrobiaceae bacterium]